MDDAIRNLLACLACPDGAALPAAIAGLPAPAWEQVAEQASLYDVAPLLYRRLRRADPPPVLPVEAEQILAGLTLYVAERNRRLRRQLSQLLNAFQGAGIPAVVLKGNHLAELVYEDPALRLIGDIDLLVPQDALPGCEGVLQEIGYRPNRVNEWPAQTYGHLVYHPPAKGPSVELHWSISRPGDPFTVDVEGLWNRAQQATIAGAGASVLCVEDLIIHTCLHAAYQHHFLVGLRPFCDLAEIIRHYGDAIRWDQLQQRARRWGAGNCVYLTLLLTQRWLGAAIPAAVWRDLAPAQADDRVIEWAERRIFSTVNVGDDPGSNGLGALRVASGIRGKLAAFLAVCFPPRRVLVEKYALPPDAAGVYLYYPVRLAGLLRRHLPRAWRLLRHDTRTVAWSEREEARIGLLQWLAPIK
jgi:hypothetical protein